MNILFWFSLQLAIIFFSLVQSIISIIILSLCYRTINSSVGLELVIIYSIVNTIGFIYELVKDRYIRINIFNISLLKIYSFSFIIYLYYFSNNDSIYLLKEYILMVILYLISSYIVNKISNFNFVSNKYNDIISNYSINNKLEIQKELLEKIKTNNKIISIYNTINKTTLFFNMFKIFRILYANKIDMNNNYEKLKIINDSLEKELPYRKEVSE